MLKSEINGCLPFDNSATLDIIYMYVHPLLTSV